MPAETSWYIEKHVINSRFYGTVTADDITRQQDDLSAFIAAGESPLHLLMDVRDVQSAPSDFRKILPALRQFGDDRQIVSALLISDSTLQNFLSVLASRFIGIPVRTFKTMEQADQFLARHNLTVSQPE